MSWVVYAGLLSALFGFVSLILPLRFLGIRSRRAGLVVLCSGFLVGTAGAAWPARLLHAAGPHRFIDDFLPAYQFHEFHSTTVHAPPDRVYRAIKAVTPREIRYLDTLLWLRALPARLLLKDRPPALLPHYSARRIDRKEAGEHEFATGGRKGERQRIRGKATFVTYEVEEGAPPAPAARIIASYETAVRKRGGVLVWHDDCCTSTMRIPGKGEAAWVEVAASENGRRYRLTVVEEGDLWRAETGPMLDVLTRSGFLLLAEKTNREIVLGTVDRYWKAEGGAPPELADPKAFQAFDDPDYAKVTANFTVKDDGGGWSRVTTETRIFATDPPARRKFAVYWRLIYPGSSLIRRAWLDAIKDRAERDASPALDRIAEPYVRLVLAMGQHDADYVDAYFGPPAWQERAKAEKKPLAAIRREASALVQQLEGLDLSGQEEIVQLRREYLAKQLRSLSAFVEMREGKRLKFDDESRALYDAVAPSYPESHFREILGRLDAMLPGKGPLVERYERFRRGFTVPKEKVDSVFTAAIEEARRRTKKWITLPEGESFTVEYVTDKPWSGYNWYKGNARSVIQVNIDLPTTIDRALDLAAHEGYPGHHVYNALLEQHLVRERGWVEFSVYPLFSPQSLIAEGSANFGIEVAFPGEEQINFKRDVLFPLAGLDPARARKYHDVGELHQQLDYAGNEVARRYLNGEIDKEQAVEKLGSLALMPEDRARQRVRFFDKYRSYVINYNLGRDLVRKYIEARGGTADRPEKRWEEFRELLSSPRLPSGLRVE